MYRLTIVAALAAACASDPEPFTWGDVVQPFSEAYCTRGAECLGLDDHEYTVCTRHAYSHLCELDGLCDTEVDAATLLLLLDLCEADMRTYNCFWVYWGNVPASCNDVLALRPDYE